MKSSKPEFVHLHLHTDHSLLDGVGRSVEYVAMAEQYNMPAIAITDHGQLYGIPAHVDACKDAGLKAIVGCEWYVNDNRHDTAGEAEQRRIRKATEAETFDDPSYQNYHLVTLAMNETGWRNMLKLNHDSVRNGYYYRPRTTHDKVCELNEGMFATTACIGSAFGQAILRGEMKEAERLFAQFHDAFGDRFYAEIHFNEIKNQHVVNQVLLSWCKKHKVPFAITDDVHYACQGEDARQDESIAIAYHKPVGEAFALDARELYFGSVREITEKARKWNYDVSSADIKRGLAYTLEINSRIENFDPSTGHMRAPRYRADDGTMPEDAFALLRSMTMQGFKKLIKQGIFPADGYSIGEYEARLKFELQTIRKQGMADYYLVCWDAVRYCKLSGIYSLVRGSGNGSLVACCIGLTAVDPVRWKLLFERFLDPQRKEPPDFDIDMSSRRRGEVRDYIMQKYGEEGRCLPVIALQTHKSRSAIRSVGKAHGVSEAILNSLCRIADQAVDFSSEQALSESSGKDRDEQITEVIGKFREEAKDKTAEWLDANEQQFREMMFHTGRARGRGRHAAALALSCDPLEECVPIDRVGSDKDAEYVTAWGEGQARQDLSRAGVLKMDLLGLNACDIIADTAKLIEELRGEDVMPKLNTLRLPDDDAKMMEEFCTGAGYGLHEVSTGRDRIAGFMGHMRPQTLKDMVACLALYRPGSMEFCNQYVDRMRGDENVPRVHPLVDAEVEETYGIIIYQEQIMLILHNVGGIDKREAYTIIKAISKKKREVIAKARKQFIAGAKKNKVKEEDAASIFDLIQKWAGYGFNRSHSTGYALLSGVTAWLRGHYPLEFYTTVINLTKNESAKRGIRAVEELIQFVRGRGIKVLPVDVQSSVWLSKPDIDRNAIQLGYNVVPRVGDAAGQVIAEHAPYKHLGEFMQVCESNKVNVTVMDQLAKVGALTFVPDKLRNIAYDAIDQYRKSTKRKNASRTRQAMNKASENKKPPVFADHHAMRDEREALGFNLRYNPFEIRHREEQIEKLYKDGRIGKFQSGSRKGIVAVVTGIEPMRDKRGRAMAKVNALTVCGEQLLIMVFSDIWKRTKATLRVGKVYLMHGEKERHGRRLLLGVGTSRLGVPVQDIDKVNWR